MLDLSLETLIFLLQLIDPISITLKQLSAILSMVDFFFFLGLCAQKAPALTMSPSEQLPGVCHWFEGSGCDEMFKRFFLFS